MPGQHVNDTFDAAFPPGTANQYHEDPLVVFEPPRIRFAASTMATAAAMYKPAIEQTKPYLVSRPTGACSIVAATLLRYRLK